MTGVLTGQIWTKDTLFLADILGAEHIRAVGGCVRDVLLHRPVNDIDFATTHAPQTVIDRLLKAGVNVIPTGLAHGTVTACLNGKNYEITTLREDVETYGRRAVVKFTIDWAVDAQRRDFTINAFYMDVDGQIFDGSGQGIDDLVTKTLRFIGDPHKRIKEDYLRILRLFRFLSQLDGFTADQNALNACAQEKDGLSLLSGERVTAEWDKWLAGHQADRAIQTMIGTGLEAIYPVYATAEMRMASLRPYNRDHLALAYALCFEDNIPPVFVFSRKRAGYIGVLLSLRTSSMSWQECAYRHGHDMAVDLYLWRCITGNIAVSQEIIEQIKHYKVPVSPITSQALIKQGFHGAELGKKLSEETENWIKSHFSNF